MISTNSKAEPPQCTSLAWSADGQVKYCSVECCIFDCISVVFFPGDYTHSLLSLITTADSPANMRGTKDSE